MRAHEGGAPYREACAHVAHTQATAAYVAFAPMALALVLLSATGDLKTWSRPFHLDAHSVRVHMRMSMRVHMRMSMRATRARHTHRKRGTARQRPHW